MTSDCDAQGVLQGFELIHQWNPDDSAKELRMAVHDKNPKGYYMEEKTMSCPSIPDRIKNFLLE